MNARLQRPRTAYAGRGIAGRRQAVFLLRIILALLIFLWRPAENAVASSRASMNQDIVFLIDISSSMQHIFTEIRQSVLEYVRGTQLGDTVILITFGEKVDLRIRQKISSEEDIRCIERELARLEPTDYHTYITGAMHKGMQELHKLATRNPDHLRTLILISDGKNNPPEGVSDPLTFETLLERYGGLIKAANTIFFYVSLGDDPDPEVVTFMESAGGDSFDLGSAVSSFREKGRQLAFAQIFVEPVSLDLGTITGPKATSSVSLAFFPACGNPSGEIINISFSPRFGGNPSLKTLGEIMPASFNCSDKAWSRSFFIKIDTLHEGTLTGELKLEPEPGDVLLIEPPVIPVTMTIRQPRVKVPREAKLEFGPIDPRRAFVETKTVPLFPNAAAVAEQLRADVELQRPEGLTVETAFEEKGENRELLVTVSTSDDFCPERSMKLEGTIHLSGARDVVGFSRNQIELSVKVLPPPARSGIVTGFWKWGKWTLVAVAALMCIFLVAVSLKRALPRIRSATRLEGKLVLIHFKEKSQNQSKTSKLNLQAIGRTVGRDTLSVGSSKEAAITLPHISVAPHHCEIYARTREGKKRILIAPVGKNVVIVNLQKIAEPTGLVDRDILEIGAYTFRFENPHPYKQVVVRYLDGRILKGTPASWDIEADGFNLLPRDALPGSSEEIYVPFAHLKAVYFVRDFDGVIGKKIISPASQIRGVHMKLIFHDGEQMDGYTSEGYTPDSPRFYFFPSDQGGNIISLVVERQNLKTFQALDAERQS